MKRIAFRKISLNMIRRFFQFLFLLFDPVAYDVNPMKLAEIREKLQFDAVEVLGRVGFDLAHFSDRDPRRKDPCGPSRSDRIPFPDPDVLSHVHHPCLGGIFAWPFQKTEIMGPLDLDARFEIRIEDR